MEIFDKKTESSRWKSNAEETSFFAEFSNMNMFISSTEKSFKETRKVNYRAV